MRNLGLHSLKIETEKKVDILKLKPKSKKCARRSLLVMGGSILLVGKITGGIYIEFESSEKSFL